MTLIRPGVAFPSVATGIPVRRGPPTYRTAQMTQRSVDVNVNLGGELSLKWQGNDEGWDESEEAGGIDEHWQEGVSALGQQIQNQPWADVHSDGSQDPGNALDAAGVVEEEEDQDGDEEEQQKCLDAVRDASEHDEFRLDAVRDASEHDDDEQGELLPVVSEPQSDLFFHLEIIS